MKYCVNCGKEVDDTITACVNCGAQMQTDSPTYADKGGFGWGALGFFIPVVGLVLYLVWKDMKPKNSKAAGIGALVSIVIGTVIWMLIIISMITAIVGIMNANPYYYY